MGHRRFANTCRCGAIFLMHLLHFASLSSNGRSSRPGDAEEQPTRQGVRAPIQEGSDGGDSVTRDSRLHPTAMKTRRWGVMLALLILIPILQVTSPSPVRAGAVPVLEPRHLQPGEFLTVRGAGIDPLEGHYSLFLGANRVGRKLIRRSSTKLIEFQAQVDPGTYDVSLVPSDETGIKVLVGTVTVDKFILPRPDSELTPGRIQVRLAPEAHPESIADKRDSFVRQFPDDDANSKLGRWYLVDVP